MEGVQFGVMPGHKGYGYEVLVRGVRGSNIKLVLRNIDDIGRRMLKGLGLKPSGLYMSWKDPT